MTENKADLSIKSIVFWRHVVGILVILLFQRGAENLPHFLGRWLGTTTIALAGAGLICGIGYLFFTSLLKTRVVRIFVTCAWVLAALQLFGQWALPDLVTKISNTQSTVNLDDFSTIVPGQDNSTSKKEKILFSDLDTPVPEPANKSKVGSVDWNQFTLVCADSSERLKNCVCVRNAEGQKLQPWELPWDKPTKLASLIAHCTCGGVQVDLKDESCVKMVLVPGTTVQ